MTALLFRIFVICIAGIATAAILVWGVGWSTRLVFPGCITSATLTIILTILDYVRS